MSESVPITPLEPSITPNPIPKTNILAKLWIGRATIKEYQTVTDPITHQTTTKLVTVVEHEPCRLSYAEYVPKVTEVSGIPSIEQLTTMHIRPDLLIKDGSKIVVTQHGRTNTYIRSGEPSVYTNHQEVLLTLDKDV